MTSRRGTLVEEGARELLQVHGYAVGCHPARLRQEATARRIWLRPGPRARPGSSASGNSRICPPRLIRSCGNVGIDLAQFRKHITRHIGHEADIHYEIWIYSLTHGFRCFEVLRDSIREIPKLSLHGPVVSRAGGVA